MEHSRLNISRSRRLRWPSTTCKACSTSSSTARLSSRRRRPRRSLPRPPPPPLQTAAQRRQPLPPTPPVPRAPRLLLLRAPALLPILLPPRAQSSSLRLRAKRSSRVSLSCRWRTHARRRRRRRWRAELERERAMGSPRLPRSRSSLARPQPRRPLTSTRRRRRGRGKGRKRALGPSRPAHQPLLQPLIVRACLLARSNGRAIPINMVCARVTLINATVAVNSLAAKLWTFFVPCSKYINYDLLRVQRRSHSRAWRSRSFPASTRIAHWPTPSFASSSTWSPVATGVFVRILN